LRFSLRELAAYELDGLAFNAQPVAHAAMACARLEDELLFYGAAGLPGLLTASCVQKVHSPIGARAGALLDDLIRP
jgi:hypothetical protein